MRDIRVPIHQCTYRYGHHTRVSWQEQAPCWPRDSSSRAGLRISLRLVPWTFNWFTSIVSRDLVHSLLQGPRREKSTSVAQVIASISEDSDGERLEGDANLLIRIINRSFTAQSTCCCHRRNANSCRCQVGAATLDVLESSLLFFLLVSSLKYLSKTASLSSR